ncbi:MAG: hypothetical protein KAS66_03900 [Candidatus Omnitrophica bacterium]|nr:hypothetical protein [Candidatus Omnitrophota bacterium]
MDKIRFLTNTHAMDQSKTLKSLYIGHEGKRYLFVGKPKATPMITYSQPELIKQGMIGIYERGSCGCSMCTKGD